jgi:hypothetical protein
VAALPTPERDVSDEIVLTLPGERRFYDVAHLVMGGLAARLNLTVDNFADLQLALAGLLPRGERGEDVTVVLRVAGEMLSGRIGPFDTEPLRRELEREGGDGYGTHHFLETVFDSYRLEVQDGGAWVEFTMAISHGEREA